MRRFPFLFAIALCLVSSVALAQSDRVTAQFEALAASGISGDARLNPMQQGGVRVQGHLSGLQPNTEYVSLVFQDASCPAAGISTELVTFTSNPAGKANYNVLVSQDISTIGSISVRLASDPATTLACATLNQ